MKSHINYPRCGRCGYQYTPKVKRRVLLFKTSNGNLIACENCIAEFDKFLQTEHTEEEKDAFLDSFKVADPEEAEQ